MSFNKYYATRSADVERRSGSEYDRASNDYYAVLYGFCAPVGLSHLSRGPIYR
jgi:hypothetical protein